MMKETDRLEREIEQEKAALDENLDALQLKAREFTDWRLQVRRRPLGAVGVALASGIALSMLAGSRRPRARRAAAEGEAYEEAPSLMSHPLLARLVEALAIVAAKKGVELLSEHVPGFAEEIETEPLGI